MRKPNLPASWTGYSWNRGRLITPEGYDFGPEDLRWLSLTVAIKQEWVRSMETEKLRSRRPVDTKVVYLREALAGAREKLRKAG